MSKPDRHSQAPIIASPLANVPTFLVPHRRPLTEHERRVLRARIRGLQRQGGRTRTVWIPIGAGVILVLWLWTLVASDAPWLVVTAFWIVVGAGIALWVRRDMFKDAKHMEDMAGSLQSALEANVAEVYDVRARAFAEFEEVEDEGACYAFELEGARLVFVVGQEFYPGARFPTLNFSIVYIVDTGGRAVDFLIEKRGGKATPARTIPAALKRQVTLPEHLEVRSGTIDSIEESLR